jgi:hypothetical protein
MDTKYKEQQKKKKKKQKNENENENEKMKKKSTVEWSEKVHKLRNDYISYSKISITYIRTNTLS